MTAEIVSLAAQKAHVSGKAKCLACKHEFVAVAPTGTIDLDCPQCGCGRAVYKYPLTLEGEIWKCRCGCDVFMMERKGPSHHELFCIGCGNGQRF